MAGRSFTRHSNGIGNRIRAEHINELQSALEEDDARIDLKTDDGQFVAHTSNTNNPHNVTKAQVGLGNVDNTSDADKPVSTAQQAALDGKADAEDAVPAGGVYGQVLTVTHSGKEWVDPPGIVYPTLLLSPDGSFDRNGPVSPTVPAAVTIVTGKYGSAWRATGSTNNPRISHDRPAEFTVITRGRATEASVHATLVYWPFNPQAQSFGLSRYSYGTSSLLINRSSHVALPDSQQGWDTFGKTIGMAGRISASSATLVVENEGAVRVASGPAPALTPIAGASMELGYFANGTEVEQVLIYPVPTPVAEIIRILTMPTAWTPANTAVNMALQSQPAATPTGASLLSYFPPNRKIAAGGATLRTAPGASTTAITTLAAGTDVHSTGQTVTASSVSYTLIMTSLGQGFVPTTALI